MRTTAFKADLEDNGVLFYMYVVALPVARLLVAAGCSANVITGLSFVLAAFSCVALLLDQNVIFGILWLLSILLDLCDGMVARLKQTASAGGFDIDSFADILKMVMLFLTIEYSTDDLGLSMSTSLLLGCLLAHRVVNSKPPEMGPIGHGQTVPQGLASGEVTVKLPRGWRSFVLVPVGTFNAHSLVLLVLPAFVGATTCPIYWYFSLVLVVQIWRSTQMCKTQHLINAVETE